MTKCKYITKNGRCGLKGSYAYRHGCFGEDMCRFREPMTNADRIRAMSDEELAKFLDMCESMGYEDSSIATDSGGHCMDMLEWLKQPAE